MIYKPEDFDLLIFFPNFHLSHAVQLTFFLMNVWDELCAVVDIQLLLTYKNDYFYVVQFN